jgi:dihydroflavonol-4-reductase
VARVFVTGGNGFMGSRVVKTLVARGHAVTALVGADLDTSNLDGVDAEVRPLELLDEGGVRAALEGGEYLVHNAACYSFWEPDPMRIYRVNVNGTQNVLSAARERGYRKIVYTSSSATLTPSINRDLETEESLFDLRHFQGHYKCSKVIAEIAVLRQIARGLPAVIVHPTTVIGEGDRRPTPTGGIVIHFINGRMKVYANTVMNVVDVDDVAEGHALALERGEVGHQYILGGENLTLGEVTRLLSELTGIPAPRVAIPARLLRLLGRANEWVADHFTHRTPLVDVESTLHALANKPSHSGKAEKELGYRPSVARFALAKATRWFVANGYCKPSYAERIARHGVLERVLAEYEAPQVRGALSVDAERA